MDEIADMPAVHARGNVEAVAGSPIEIVQRAFVMMALHHRTVGVLIEPAEDDIPPVGFAVSIGIFQIDEFRTGSDEDASLPGCDSGDPTEIVRKDNSPVEDAVAIVVAQFLDPADFRIGNFLMTAKFGNKEIAFFSSKQIATGSVTRGSAAINSRRKPGAR